MSARVTFRISDKQAAKVRRRAKLAGKTVSAFLRELLNRELDRDPVVRKLDTRPMGERIKHLSGCLSFDPDGDPWRKAIRERNWRE
jgi:mobilization protein NikA